MIKIHKILQNFSIDSEIDGLLSKIKEKFLNNAANTSCNYRVTSKFLDDINIDSNTMLYSYSIEEIVNTIPEIQIKQRYYPYLIHRKMKRKVVKILSDYGSAITSINNNTILDGTLFIDKILRDQFSFEHPSHFDYNLYWRYYDISIKKCNQCDTAITSPDDCTRCPDCNPKIKKCCDFEKSIADLNRPILSYLKCLFSGKNLIKCVENEIINKKKIWAILDDFSNLLGNVKITKDTIENVMIKIDETINNKQHTTLTTLKNCCEFPSEGCISDIMPAFNTPGCGINIIN